VYQNSTATEFRRLQMEELKREWTIETMIAEN
jgi:hypothetical protein